MRIPIVFPDGEAVIVEALNAVFAAYGEAVSVSTRKKTPQQETGISAFTQVVVRSDGGTVSRLTKEEDFGLNIYVLNPSRNTAYAEANRLGGLLEGLLVVLPQYSAHLTFIRVNGSTPIEVDSEEQQRYLRITAVLRGSELTI